MCGSSLHRLPVLSRSSGCILQLPRGTIGGSGTGVQPRYCHCSTGRELLPMPSPCGMGTLSQLLLFPVQPWDPWVAHGLVLHETAAPFPCLGPISFSFLGRMLSSLAVGGSPTSVRLHTHSMWLGILRVVALSTHSCVLFAGCHLNKWLQPGYRTCLGSAG